MPRSAGVRPRSPWRSGAGGSCGDSGEGARPPPPRCLPAAPSAAWRSVWRESRSARRMDSGKTVLQQVVRDGRPLFPCRREAARRRRRSRLFGFGFRAFLFFPAGEKGDLPRRAGRPRRHDAGWAGAGTEVLPSGRPSAASRSHSAAEGREDSTCGSADRSTVRQVSEAWPARQRRRRQAPDVPARASLPHTEAAVPRPQLGVQPLRDGQPGQGGVFEHPRKLQPRGPTPRTGCISSGRWTSARLKCRAVPARKTTGTPSLRLMDGHDAHGVARLSGGGGASFLRCRAGGARNSGRKTAPGSRPPQTAARARTASRGSGFCRRRRASLRIRPTDSAR